MSKSRKYPEELLERGVRLVFESGRPIAHVAADLGVGAETLRKRVRQAESDSGKRTEGKKVALVLVGFAFVAQLIAGIFSFLGRDGVAATAMLTLALNWLVVGAVLWTSKPGSTSDVLGLFLLFAGTAMMLLAATAGLSKLVPALVFAAASIRFLLTGIYEISSHHGWEEAAGIVGLVLFVLAMYAAWASALEDATGQTILPFGRRGKGKIA